MKKYAFVPIVAASIMWGFIGLFVNIFAELGFSSIQIIAIRSTISFLCMLVVVLIKNPKLLKVKLKDVWMFIGTGILSFTLFNYCYFTTITTVSTSVAAVLLNTAPIFVSIIAAIVFKEKLTLQKIISLAITFMGCIFITGLIGSDTQVSMDGILLGVLSGFLYALYSIFGSVALKKYDTLTVTTYTFFFSTLAAIPMAGFTGTQTAVLLQPQTLLYAGLMSLLVCVIPYFLYNIGLSKMESSKAAITSMLEPVVASFVSVFILGEAMTVTMVLGIILILGAVVFLNVKLKPKQPLPLSKMEV